MNYLNSNAITKFNNTWVKWTHNWYSPAYNNAQKMLNIASSILSFGKHCSICLNINGCCFPINNMPEYPLHENCHCRLIEVHNIAATAICDINKFEKYVFNEDNKINKGKKALFESLGYAKIDSVYLQNEFTEQAKIKYLNGDFILGLLDIYGQRITIEIVLPRKDKIGIFKFKAGFIVYPDGEIKLTTPYAGVIK